MLADLFFRVLSYVKANKSYLVVLVAVVIFITLVSDGKRDLFTSPDEAVISYFIDHPFEDNDVYQKITDTGLKYIHPRGIYISNNRLTPVMPHGTIWLNSILTVFGEIPANFFRALIFVLAFMFFQSQLKPDSTRRMRIVTLIVFITLPSVIINFRRTVLYDIPALSFFLGFWGLLLYVKRDIDKPFEDRKLKFAYFFIGLLGPTIVLINFRAAFWVIILGIVYLIPIAKKYKNLKPKRILLFLFGGVIGTVLFLISNFYFYQSFTLTSYKAQAISFAESSGLKLPYVFFNEQIFENNVKLYYFELFGALFICYILITGYLIYKKQIDKKLLAVTVLLFLIITFYFSNLGGWGSRSTELTGSFLRYMLPLLLVMCVTVFLYPAKKYQKYLELLAVVLIIINFSNYGFSLFNISSFKDSERQIRLTQGDLLNNSTERTLFITQSKDKFLFPQRIVANSWFFHGQLFQNDTGNYWQIETTGLIQRLKEIFATGLIDEVIIDRDLFYNNSIEITSELKKTDFVVHEKKIGNFYYILITENEIPTVSQ